MFGWTGLASFSKQVLPLYVSAGFPSNYLKPQSTKTQKTDSETGPRNQEKLHLFFFLQIEQPFISERNGENSRK